MARPKNEAWHFAGSLRTITVTLELMVMFVLAIFAAQLAEAQTFTVLHTFTNGSDGAGPGSLTKDAAGNFYGTTAYGGLGNDCASGCGTAYRLLRHGSSFVFYPIYEFANTNHGPINPAGRLVFGLTAAFTAPAPTAALAAPGGAAPCSNCNRLLSPVLPPDAGGT
jgi:hypothetical protein